MKKRKLKFEIGNVIQTSRHGKTFEATIDYISFTNEKYIFKEPIQMELSKISSMSFDRVEEIFTLKQ